MVSDGHSAGTRPESLTVQEVAHWVERRIPNCQPFRGDVVAIPIFVRGQQIAGVVWHSYDHIGRNIEGAIAADNPRWCSRRVLHLCFAPPFLALECRRVTARCNVSNPKSRRLLEGLGFQVEGLMRQAADDGGDVLIYGMLKEECRWIERP